MIFRWLFGLVFGDVSKASLGVRLGVLRMSYGCGFAFVNQGLRFRALVALECSTDFGWVLQASFRVFFAFWPQQLE